MSIEEIYNGAERLINQLIKKESFDQGHYLTGKMDDSMEAGVSKKGKADLMEGFSVYYAKFVNEGLPAASASWKQFPFLIRYFQQRGLEENEAKGAAAATIKTWMKEGMPTQASKRYSKTGSRTNMIESAFVGGEEKINSYMGSAFDHAVNEAYLKEKSEVI